MKFSPLWKNHGLETASSRLPIVRTMLRYPGPSSLLSDCCSKSYQPPQYHQQADPSPESSFRCSPASPVPMLRTRQPSSSTLPASPYDWDILSVGIRGHMGHIGILVVVVRRLSRWKVKTLLAGPSPTSPMRRRLPTPLFPTLRHQYNFSMSTPQILARPYPVYWPRNPNGTESGTPCCLWSKIFIAASEVEPDSRERVYEICSGHSGTVGGRSRRFLMLWG